MFISSITDLVTSVLYNTFYTPRFMLYSQGCVHHEMCVNTSQPSPDHHSSSTVRRPAGLASGRAPARPGLIVGFGQVPWVPVVPGARLAPRP